MVSTLHVSMSLSLATNCCGGIWAAVVLLLNLPKKTGSESYGARAERRGMYLLSGVVGAATG